MSTAFALLLGLVIFVFGFAAIIGKHKQLATWIGRTISKLSRWVWKHYRQYLLGVVSGIVLTLWSQGYFR